MSEMTTHARMTRILNHQEADRCPITDDPWGATLERWHREGLPGGVYFGEYFGLDRVVTIGADNSPRFPAQVIQETEEWTERTTSWGTRIREWKHAGGVPEFLDHRIKDPDSWREAKARMVPSRDRVNWDYLKKHYATWREQGAWIEAGFWFGFDVVHSHAVGTERVLVAMVEQPEWVKEMIDHWLDVHLALFQMVWDEGYQFDMISWPDDMGYKGHQFFSPAMYRELVKPAHKRAADWAHAKGLKVRLHSCGNIEPLIPDILDAGIDVLNPLEVKSGLDPIALKAQWGDRLSFHGGLNAVLFDHPDQLWEEMRRVIPEMKRGGGYWISSDHSVPQSVSLDTFREFVRLGKELGSYQ
jgi:uroporphyrinogen decarboxylase